MRYLDIPYFKQDTQYTCGPTSLQMVLAYYGIRESEAALAAELGTDPDTGTAHQQMITAVLKRGLHCYVNDEATWEELGRFVSSRIPVIIRFLETDKNEDHYAVVVGADEAGLVVHDPWHGEHVRFTRREFAARWTCDLLGTCSKWLMAVSREPLPMGRQYHPYES